MHDEQHERDKHEQHAEHAEHDERDEREHEHPEQREQREQHEQPVRWLALDRERLAETRALTDRLTPARVLDWQG